MFTNTNSVVFKFTDIEGNKYQVPKEHIILLKETVDKRFFIRVRDSDIEVEEKLFNTLESVF